MGRMMDIAREVANRSYRTSAEETRRSLFTEQTKKNLREQWRDSARKDSRVYLHLFNEAQGIEFYVTGWDGGDTISALTNDGFRNVSLNEVRGCKADSRWDDKTPLWAVMEDHEPIAESRGGMTRTRYSAFDTTFANFKRVIGENTDPRSNRKIVGESRKFAMGESFAAPKWIVAVNHHNEWKAATRHRDLPMNYLPVEVVRAFTENEAIGKGRELHESGTPQVVHQSKNAVSPFIRGAGGMTLDMNALMEEARLDEGKETALKYGIKNPNSSGQGFHADHAKNPYHDMLEKAGLKYSHSTPVGEYRSDKFTLHHAYRLNRNFAVSVQKSAKSGNYLWSGGKSGSGRSRNGKTSAELKKYLKGAVKRHGALGESLVRMPVTEGVIGESMRVAKHFYVVDKRTGKVVSRGFPQVDDADEFFEKDKNFKHKTHQVISGWALSDRAFKLSEARSKTMVIMRGLPGSGKSTAAKKAAGSAPIYSTDDFFMKGGEYKFDRSKIVKAHEWNQKRTKKALAKGLPKIVIDNTNVQLWEMRAYVEMAQEHGYDVEFVVAKTPWAWNVPKLTKRNTHGVPEEIISRMKSDFQRSATVKKVLASKAPWE